MHELPEHCPASPPGARAGFDAGSLWLALLVGAITLAVFSPVLRYAFLHWDDNYFICGNPELAHPTAAGLATFWTHIWSGYNQFSVPLTYTIWWVLAKLQPVTGGAGAAPVLFPWTFHALNLAFHVLAAVLVFLILKRLVGSAWAAGAGALFFALHPLQVEPVAWAANMYTPLSGALAFAALLAWMSFSDSRHAAIGRTNRGFTAGQLAVFAIGTLCFVLALLSKPSVVLLPVIAGAIDILLRRRRLRDCAPLAIWLLIAAADAVITSHVHKGIRAFRPALWQRPLVAGDALAFYLGRLVYPFGLVPDYGRTPQWVLGHAWVWATAMVAPLLMAILWLLRRRAPWLLAGAVVFVLGCLPMLGLVPFDFQGFSTVGDRYVYLSLLGAAIVVTFAVQCLIEMTRRSSIGPAAIALSAIVLVPTSRRQLSHWRDTRALFDYTLAVNPDSNVAHLQLGYMLLTGGSTPAEWNEALRDYKAVEADRPEDAHLRCNIGLALLRLDRPADAVAYFRRARQIAPQEPSAAYLLGSAYLACHDRPGAIAAFTQAVHDFPDLADAELQLANLLSEAGDASDATLHYHRFLHRHPNSVQALAGLQKLQHRQQQATADPR